MGERKPATVFLIFVLRLILDYIKFDINMKNQKESRLEKLERYRRIYLNSPFGNNLENLILLLDFLHILR